MEKKEPIKISLSTFFLILAIIVIVVMGYFIYKNSNEKMVSENEIKELNKEIADLKEKEITIEDTVKEKINTAASENITNESIEEKEIKNNIQVSSFYYSVAVLYDGEVYVNVYGSTTEIDNLYGNGTYQTLIKTRNNYKEYTFGNSDVTINNENFTGIKLNVTDVKKIYDFEDGQAMGKNYGFILLKDDGTLSIISLYSLINGKTEVTDVKGISNVEKIITKNEDGQSTYAVTKDNQEIDLTNYVPKDYKKF